DRGLMGWDRRANRYDLHPVVRGVIWSVLDPSATQGIYQQLASNIQPLAQPNDNSFRSIDDLAGVIELYHTLVRLRRASDAAEIFGNRIFDPAVDNLAAYRECAELIELLIEEPGLVDELDRQGPGFTEALMTFLSICYVTYGDAGRAFMAFQRYREEDPTAVEFQKEFESIILYRLGRLADAEVAARVAFNSRRPDVDPITLQALGTLAFLCGQYIAGAAWLSDNRLNTHNADYRAFFGALNLLELGLMALRRDDVNSARGFSNQLFEKATVDS